MFLHAPGCKPGGFPGLRKVKYIWEGGVIGNTSTQKSGPTVFHSLNTPLSMVVVGSTAYVATGYNEGMESGAKFNVADPYSKTGYPCKPHETSLAASDGKYVYWAAEDDPMRTDPPFGTWYTKTALVFATRPGDDSDVTFAHGTTYKVNRQFGPVSTIDLIQNTTKSVATGLAVQDRSESVRLSRPDERTPGDQQNDWGNRANDCRRGARLACCRWCRPSLDD